ncbi:MAG TPA: pyridoxamine 5'-phosphate oxidase [Pyrinomonadaceae bacterium]|jgi:pyridoxamine 5'-phosphate oxidase|nr:pyridoxamine 5'-phosphate oxidase [Pyrinomonadaceae bacterium]
MNDSPHQYNTDSIDEQTVDRDPLTLFQRWLHEARAVGINLAEAMTLATATPEGKPSARLVLLKQADEHGFVFFTNYHSMKARELDSNPQAALVFYWPQLERQVRVEGKVERTPAAESDAYFKTRPRESQIGALASPQSQVIASRAALQARADQIENSYEGREVERPAHWGGYRLHPERIEFWKGRPGRLHDRISYERETDGSWTIKRLAP